MAGSRKYMAANDAAAERNGSGKHWTKQERADRLASEVKPQQSKKVMAPKWLTDETLRAEFYGYTKILQSMNVGFCQTDADFLAWYLTARQEYNAVSAHVRRAINSGDVGGASKWTRTRNTLFSEARSCAQMLGLSVDARCRLIAQPPQIPEDDPLDKLTQRLQLLKA